MMYALDLEAAVAGYYRPISAPTRDPTTTDETSYGHYLSKCVNSTLYFTAFLFARGDIGSAFRLPTRTCVLRRSVGSTSLFSTVQTASCLKRRADEVKAVTFPAVVAWTRRISCMRRSTLYP